MMSQYVTRNPFTTAAAVFAPFFTQNEDRGFFRTALITTPIVFASGQIVPKIFGGVRDFAGASFETVNLLKKSEKRMRFEQPNFHDLNTLFKNPNTSSNEIDRALSQYLVAERRSRDFLKEQKVLTKYFNRRFVKPEDLISKASMGNLDAIARVQEIEALQATKGRLITNALHVARRSSLTPLEWDAELIGSKAYENFTNEQMIDTFNKYKDRPEFVKTLKNRLREISKLNYEGPLAMADDVPAIKSTFTSAIDFGFDDPSALAFKAQAPEAYEYLEKAAKNRRLTSVEIEAEAVVKGEVGRLLNVKVSRREGGNIKKVTIPIVDTETGTVRLGPNAIGVGDYVIAPDLKNYRIDSWISKMIAEEPSIPISNKPGLPSLESEIAAHAYWQAGDPMDARRIAELASFGGDGTSDYTAQARKLRSNMAKITKLPLFINEEGENVSFSGLSYKHQVNTIRDALNTNQYINMGPEAGTYEMRLVLRKAANLSPFGIPSAEKQDPIWRSVTKEFQLSYDELPDNAKLGWRNAAWKELTGEAELPAATFTVAGINPQDRTLFSELPKTLTDLHFQRAEVTQKFIERGMSGTDAADLYNTIYEMYNKDQQGALANLGGMGETVTMMKPDFAQNFRVQGIRKYNLTEAGIKEGDTVATDTVLGFNEYDRVLPIHGGKVLEVAKSKKGITANILHTFNMQGAKLDIAGVKGMNRVMDSDEQFEQVRSILNKFYKATDSGDYISENVNVLAPAEYLNYKVDPAHAYMDIASDVVKRLQSAGASDVTDEYLASMAKEGVDYTGGQLVINTLEKKALTDKAASERFLRLIDINEEFFRQAGDAIKAAGGYQDPVLTAYVNSGKELGDWMLKNQLPAMAFSWDHSLVNSPRFATITHDVETYMAQGQNYAGLKALRSRVNTVSGGDPRETLDFMKYIMQGDYSKELGTTVPIADAFLSKGDLHAAADRAGTIFDPSVDKYKKSFRVDLGGGNFLPVPGTEAYGAEANMYEPGTYQTMSWQETIQELAFENDPSAKAELTQRVIEQYKEQFATGKHSALRPHQYDPMGVSGVLATSAEQGEPFVAKISPEVVSKVHSARIREALLRGEEVMGALHRQPTNASLMYMKYKMDKSLAGTLDIAVPERISRYLVGDQDKDTVNALLFDANIKMEGDKVITTGANQLEIDAANEALDYINNGKQLMELEAWESVMGTGEVARFNTTFEPPTLAGMAEKFAGKVQNRVGVAVNRTAGAAIGPYSNVLTEVSENLVRNTDLVRDQARVARLNAGLFENIRQAPISARKAHTPFSLETAMQKIDQLKKAVAAGNSETAADNLHKLMLDMSSTLQKTGKDSSIYKYWETQGAEDIRVWSSGRTESAQLAKQAFTSTIDIERPFSQQFAAKNLKTIFSDLEGVLGPHHGGMTASAESASKLGSYAENLATIGRDAAESATGKIGKIFAEHGKAAAIGLGALATLGVALTRNRAPVASFSRVSGNKYRPEETMGVSDSVPGEPVAGIMAPSSPPRRTVHDQPGVKTSVVVPLRQTSDLSVRMKATDQSRAAETVRMLSQIPGTGESNVTINYRDRTKLRSLRTREKIREMR